MATNEIPDFGSAVVSFREALQQIWASPEAEQEIIEAYSKYSTTLLQALQASEISARASETYADYFQKIKETFASDEDWEHVDQAFRQYAENLKKAWISTDTETMSLEEMAAIGDGIVWVTGIIGVIRRAREA